MERSYVDLIPDPSGKDDFVEYARNFVDDDGQVYRRVILIDPLPEPTTPPKPARGQRSWVSSVMVDVAIASAVTALLLAVLS